MPEFSDALTTAHTTATPDAQRLDSTSARLKSPRSNKPVNWLSSAWFKSETARYFNPLFLHARARVVWSH
jgi:hypothetical protein